MNKKKLGLFITPALILGLAACNNNDQAIEPPNEQRVYEQTNVNNDLYRVNNRYPFDHQGPLSEEYNQNQDDRNQRNGTRVNHSNQNGRNVINNGNNHNRFDHQGPLSEEYNRDRNDRNRNGTRVINNRNDDANIRERRNRTDLMNNTNNNNPNQVTNRREIRYPFDHRGPLTEDYRNGRNDRN